MCVFEYGEAIRTEEDVRNLVNSIIFRQTSPYDEQDIFDQVRACLEGSPLEVPSRELEMLVSEALRIFLLAGNMSLRNGVYSPSPLFAIA